jgi:septal ring factor EnvC (AmiA/AmiB activator)
LLKKKKLLIIKDENISNSLFLMKIGEYSDIKNKKERINKLVIWQRSARSIIKDLEKELKKKEKDFEKMKKKLENTCSNLQKANCSLKNKIIIYESEKKWKKELKVNY